MLENSGGDVDQFRGLKIGLSDWLL